MEVKNELKVNIELEYGIKIASIERCEPRIPTYPQSKQNLLSDTDKNLLKLSFANKKNCILITDDQTLRKIAKLNSIKCYTTPEFIAFMQKKGLISKERAIKFLENLKAIYIRKIDVIKVLNKIKKW